MNLFKKSSTEIEVTHYHKTFPYIMVDNFYDNPDEVRDYALSCEYYQPYPGNNKTPDWNGKLRKYSEPWFSTIDEHRYITEENVYYS